MRYPWYEYAIVLLLSAIGFVGGLVIAQKSWKRYGLVFLFSAVTGVGLCLAFVLYGSYAFPHNPLDDGLLLPLLPMVTFIPFTVIVGVRFSPDPWVWKIPFYWAIVHLAVLAEILLLSFTKMFRFKFGWDLWDSYTLWWLYFLFFEWVGGKIVPPAIRKPMPHELFRFGRNGWLVFHLTVISTVFIFGMYAGKSIWGK